MARDIEEFLRRAAERRQQQKGGGKKPVQRPPVRQQPLRRQSPPEPEIVEAIPVARSRKPTPQPDKKIPPIKRASLREQSVAEHVKSHIDTSDISSHAEALGDRIADVHDIVEATVHKHLDHDITVLDDTQSVTELPPPKIVGKPTNEFAMELRAMLKDQKMVGKAIILAEILKRPEF